MLRVELYPARWSQHLPELSCQSPGQASPFRGEARHLALCASIGARHSPMLGVCLHSCFALRASLRLGVVLRLLCWHGEQLLLASRPGGPRSDCSEISASERAVPCAWRLSCMTLGAWSATQVDFRSSATPASNGEHFSPLHHHVGVMLHTFRTHFSKRLQCTSLSSEVLWLSGSCTARQDDVLYNVLTLGSMVRMTF